MVKSGHVSRLVQLVALSALFGKANALILPDKGRELTMITIKTLVSSVITRTVPALFHHMDIISLHGDPKGPGQTVTQRPYIRPFN